jgi:hypothetical protein
MSQENLIEDTGIESNGALIEAPYDPLEFLPPELRAKVEAAQKEIQNSSVMSGKKIAPQAKLGNKYRFPDGTLVKKFTGIIVASMHANKHYPNAYDENNMQPPDCVAANKGADSPNSQLVPLAEVPEPYNRDCGSCPKFQWGSARQGKGKACAEYLLLALYVPALGNELVLMEQKKARAQQMDNYLRQHTTEVCPLPLLVQTEFSIGAGDDIWEQTFTAVGNTPREIVATLVPRIEEAKMMLWGALERDIDEMRKLAKARDVAFGEEAEAAAAAARPARRK